MAWEDTRRNNNLSYWGMDYVVCILILDTGVIVYPEHEFEVLVWKGKKSLWTCSSVFF